MFLRRISGVFLFLVCGAVFNSVCAAGPLMVDKNLFASDRKPPSPESAEVSAKQAKPGMAIGNLQLDGVVFESNERRAILRMKNAQPNPSAKKGQPVSPFVTVREGQIVSDFRVTKIEPKSILLEKDGQTFTISLFAENKVSAPPSPVAAPTPVQPPAPPAPPGGVPQDQQPPGMQAQPVENPPNMPQPIPGQPPLNRGFNNNRNVRQPNAYAPVPEPTVNQDPNQPPETAEEEQ